MDHIGIDDLEDPQYEPLDTEDQDNPLDDDERQQLADSDDYADTIASIIADMRP